MASNSNLVQYIADQMARAGEITFNCLIRGLTKVTCQEFPEVKRKK